MLRRAVVLVVSSPSIRLRRIAALQTGLSRARLIIGLNKKPRYVIAKLDLRMLFYLTN